MAARFESRESHKLPVFPEMAKEVIFWCTLLVAVVSGAVLVSQMAPSWPVPVWSAQSAPVSVVVEASPVEEHPAMPADTPTLDASEPADQPPTF